MPIDATRVFHVNVNCSSLERSLEFYRDGLGLDAGARTAPADVQPGEALGWAGSCRWDAWILVGDQSFAGTAIDLLEWKTPEPVIDPRAERERTGFARLVVAVKDVEACRSALVAMHADIHQDVATSGSDRTVDSSDGASLLVADPDGTEIAIVEGESRALAGVQIACRDVLRSARFYEEVLGFSPGGAAVFAGSRVPRPARRLVDRAVRFQIELVDIGALSGHAPLHGGAGAVGVASAHRQTTPRPMQALGIHRMALFTDDLDRDHAFLRAADVPCLSAPVAMDMGAGLPPLRFFCFLDPDGAVLELIEEPKGA